MEEPKSIFIGIDPSFTGLGIAIIDIENKTLTFNELSTSVGTGAFADISKASTTMTELFTKELIPHISNTTSIAMEIPPTQGMYAVKLWALDTHLYNALPIKPYLFNVSYLSFINKKYSGKRDTKLIVEDIRMAFEKLRL